MRGACRANERRETIITPTDIIFYINLGLVFCVIAETTVFVVLCRKTACAELAGYIAVALFGFGLAAYFVQLFMYVYGNKFAMHAVCAALAVMYSGIVVGAVYCILLGRNSHKALCIASGIFGFAPPIGTFFAIALSYKIERDTPMKELVFNGYAYTYAALGAFCERNGARFADAAGEEDFEPLKRKAAKKHLKALKRQANTPEGKYAYAVALLRYAPKKLKKAVALLKKAADGGHVPALFNIGYCYEAGAYVKRDVKRAREYYKRAATAGDGDAALRLCITELTDGDASAGARMLGERADGGDVYAEYDVAVCYERGKGVEKDVERAVSMYVKLARGGLFIAQKRLFALACECVNKIEKKGEFFRSVTDADYSGTGAFELMIKGLIEIMKRHAADAAEQLVGAVKRRGRWEGVARCLVGTLYIDSGEKPSDRVHGTEYVRSAVGLTPIAKDILASLPKSLIKSGKTDRKRRRE